MSSEKSRALNVLKRTVTKAPKVDAQRAGNVGIYVENKCDCFLHFRTLLVSLRQRQQEKREEESQSADSGKRKPARRKMGALFV